MPKMPDQPENPSPPDAGLPVVIAFKWGQGYPARYTNILFRALRAQMSVPFRMMCVTDDPAGLDPGIEVAPIPDFALPRDHWVPGMWPKLTAFAPGLVADGTPVLMLDVDIVVMRDLAPLFDRVRAQGGLHIIHDWADTLERWFPRRFGRDRGSNSSVVGFVAGSQPQIWAAFRDAGWDVLQADRNDQQFIHRHATDRQFWPDGWVLSFKKSLTWHFPVNLIRPVPEPKEAYLVAFHGKPDPEEVSGKPFRRWGSPEKFGFFPVAWVKRYWDRFSPGA